MPAVAPRDRSRPLPGGERRRRFEHLESRRMTEPGASTLDERISATWSVLVSEGEAGCPVCTTPIRAAEACDGCGSELS